MRASVLVWALTLMVSLAAPIRAAASDCPRAAEPWAQLQHTWSLSWHYPASPQLRSDALQAGQAAGLSTAALDIFERQHTVLLLALILTLLAAGTVVVSLPSLRRGRWLGTACAATLSLISLTLHLHGDRSWDLVTRSAALRILPSGASAASAHLPAGSLGTCTVDNANHEFCLWQGPDGPLGWIESRTVAPLSTSCARQ